MNGAGGSSGGVGHFFIGLIMMCGGFYMLLNSISVTSNFGFSARLYSVNALGGFGVTGGMILIPFLFGVGFIFYNGKNSCTFIPFVLDISCEKANNSGNTISFM